MKKVLLIIAFVAAPFFSYGQSLFDSLEEMDNVDSVIVSKDAFELLSKFNPKGVENNDMMLAFNMIKELNEFKVFSTEDASIASKMESMVKKALKSRKLTELMRLKEGNSRAIIYVKAGSNKDYVSEVLMFVKGLDKKTNGMSEAIVMSLTGNIDINKMSELANSLTKNSSIKVSRD